MINHSVSFPHFLKVYDNALQDLGSILAGAGYKKVVIYFGNDLIDLFGNTVMTSLKEAGVEVLSYKEMDIIDMQELMEFAFTIPAESTVATFSFEEVQITVLLVASSGVTVATSSYVAPD